MAQKDRLSDIIKMVRAEHKVTVSDLAKRYKVTTETIRRDLELLEKEGIVARTYGGAIAVQSAPVTSDYKVRAVKNAAAKAAIGKLAASLLPENGAVGCDSSTTVYEAIPYIRSRSSLTLLTNSVRILNDFMYDKLRIISTGGILNSRTQSLEGELAVRMMENYYLDASIIGCHSLDLVNGIYEGSEAVVQYKNTLIDHSRKIILLADHTKFDHTSLIRSASFSMINTLVTDRRPSDEWMTCMEQENVKVLYPEE